MKNKITTVELFTTIIKVAFLILNIVLLVLIGIKGYPKFLQYRESMHHPVDISDISYTFDTIPTEKYLVGINTSKSDGLSNISLGKYNIDVTPEELARVQGLTEVDSELYIVTFRNNKFPWGERKFINFSCLGQPSFDNVDLSPYLDYISKVFTNKVYKTFFFDDADAYSTGSKLRNEV